MADLERTVEILIRANAQFDKPLDALDKALIRMRKRVAESKKGTQDLQKEQTKLNKTSTQAAKGEDKLAKSTNKQGTAAAGASKKTAALGKSQQSLINVVGGVIAQFGVLAATVASIALPVREAGEFEAAMSEVKAISGATETEFQALTDIALQMGRETSFSAKQAADGLKFLAIAGLSVEEAIATLPQTLQLARAGALDLGVAADITTNIMSAFGATADELGAINDSLVKAFTSSNTNLQELGTAMVFVAPIAAGLGANFNDLTASLGLLANAGIKGSLAGTTLRGALSKLFNPTREEAEAMGELAERIGQSEINLIDAQGNFVGFTEVVRQLEQANISAAEALQIFGLRAGPGMAALLSAGSDALQAFKEELDASAGTAERIAKIMQDNFRGAVTRLQSAISGLLITIGNVLLPSLSQFADGIANIVNRLTELSQEFPKVTEYIVKITGAIIALGAAMAAIKVAGGLASLLSLPALANPVVAAILAVVATLTAVYLILDKIVQAEFGVTLAQFGEILLNQLIPYLKLAWNWLKQVQIEWQNWIWLIKLAFFPIALLIDSLKILLRYASLIPGISDELAKIRQENERIRAEQELNNLERQKSLDLERRIKEATVELREEIKQQIKEVERLGKQLASETRKFDIFKEAATDALKEIGKAITDEINNAWDQVSEAPAVRALERQLAAVNNALYEHEADRINDARDLERQITQARVAEINRATDFSIAALEQQADREKQLVKESLLILNENEDAKARAVEKANTKIRAIENATYEKKKEYYAKAREALESELDRSLAAEKKIADEILSIQEKADDARKSAAEKIRDLQRKTLSEEAAYYDEVKEVREKLSQAASLQNVDTEKSIRLYQEAMNAASSLGREVKDGEKVVVSESQAVRTAIGLVEEAEKGLTNAAEARKTVLEGELARQQQNTKTVEQSLTAISKKFDEVASAFSEGLSVEIKIQIGEFEEELTRLTAKRESIINVSANLQKASDDLGKLQKQKSDIEKAITLEVGEEYKGQLDAARQNLAYLTGKDYKVHVETDAAQAGEEFDKATRSVKTFEEAVYNSQKAVKDLSKEEFDIRVDEALESLLSVKEQVTDLGDIINEETFTINVSAIQSQGDLDATIARVKQLEQETGKEFSLNLGDVDDQQVLAVATQIRAIKNELKGIEQEGKDIPIDVNTAMAEQEVSDFKTEAEAPVEAQLQVDSNISEVLTEKQLLEQDTESTHTIHIREVREGSSGGLFARVADRFYQAGGRLPGYGGGDKIDAKLEAGEYVIRKEAVRRYGSGLFDLYNSLKMRFGGLVSNLPAMPRVNFQTGGLASSIRNLGSIELQVGGLGFPMQGDIDVITKLKDTLSRESLLRSN